MAVAHGIPITAAGRARTTPDRPAAPLARRDRPGSVSRRSPMRDEAGLPRTAPSRRATRRDPVEPRPSPALGEPGSALAQPAMPIAAVDPAPIHGRRPPTAPRLRDRRRPRVARWPAAHRSPARPGAARSGERSGGCTTAQLRRFIKSRAYVPIHEIRRRFLIATEDDDVAGIELATGPDLRRAAGARGPDAR